MRAVVFRNGVLKLETNEPSPMHSPGEALIRVRQAGICRTDLELTRGYMGFEGILGHEFVGELVESAGGFSPGDRVVGEINCGCGTCSWCRSGLERHCPHRTVVGILKHGGCMADFICLPTSNLLRIPDEITDDEAVFVEPLAAVLEIFEQLHIVPRQSVTIIGDGKLGLLTALVFKIQHPGPLSIIGHHPERFPKNLGLHFIHEHDLTENDTAYSDVVVEASGTTEGLGTAMRIIKPRGTIVLKSTMERAAPLDLTPLVINEIKVLGSRCGLFAPALEFLKKRKIPLETLRTAVYPIDAALEAWERANAPDSLKVILTMD